MNKIEDMARSKGIKPVDLVADAIEKGKSLRGAARRLGMAQSNLDYWLKSNGLAIKKTVAAELIEREPA